MKRETTKKKKQCKFHCQCVKPLENKYEKLSQYLMNQQTDTQPTKPTVTRIRTAMTLNTNTNADDIWLYLLAAHGTRPTAKWKRIVKLKCAGHN